MVTTRALTLAHPFFENASDYRPPDHFLVTNGEQFRAYFGSSDEQRACRNQEIDIDTSFQGYERLVYGWS